MNNEHADMIITIAAKVLVSGIVMTLALGCWKWVELGMMAVKAVQ